MPRTARQRDALEAAIGAAIESGKMGSIWPKNTIWLGARWESDALQWSWDDGAAIFAIKWGGGQPSSAGDQDTEPFLCMTREGDVHDSDGPYQFGVFCENKGMLHEDEAFPVRKLS